MEFIPRDFDEVTEKRDLQSAPNTTYLPSAKPNYTYQECVAAIQEEQPVFTPSIAPEYREWQLKNPLQLAWSPLRLFLLLISPILELLVFHTNISALRTDSSWKPVTILEIRRWIACRLEMVDKTPHTAAMDTFWTSNATSRRYLGQQRFRAIERFLSINSDPGPLTNTAPWYWKVQSALDLIRGQLECVFIPSSHICVDESTIKFHGRKIDTYLLTHKPAKEGFVCYTIVSYSGLIHDFIVSSSQDGPEGVSQGITIDLPTRTMRIRKKGTTGFKGKQIHLPPTKALVYVLYSRITQAFRDQQFVYYMDNLFGDPHLARALLTCNIGCCGTVRKQASGIPPILVAIIAQKKCMLAPDQIISRTVDNLVNISLWRDHLRQNTVIFISTVHSPDDLRSTQRRSTLRRSSEHRSGFVRPTI